MDTLLIGVSGSLRIRRNTMPYIYRSFKKADLMSAIDELQDQETGAIAPFLVDLVS